MDSCAFGAGPGPKTLLRGSSAKRDRVMMSSVFVFQLVASV